MSSIAIVDDEKDLREIIEIHLKKSNLKTLSYSNGKDFLQSLSQEVPDVVILDIMMDGINGYEVLTEIKKKFPDIGVLMLSAKSQTFDKVLGLDLGADDYLTKPFQKEELLARIKSLLRRKGKEIGKKTIDLSNYLYEDLVFNPEDKTLIIDNKEIDLTKTEFMILKLLTSYPGKVFDRDSILDYAWDDSIVNERTIDVHIRRLRKKMGKYNAIVKTHSGLGYSIARFNPAKDSLK